MHIAKLGDRVRIEYFRLPEPTAASDKPRRRKTLEFKVGSRDLTRSLSLGVVGMAPGDRKQITLPPRKAYGKRKAGLVQEIPRKRFPEHLELKVGTRLTALHSSSGRRRRVRVVELKPDTVVVDGNHALAEKSIELEVNLISLDSSSNANQSKPQFDNGGES